MRAETLRMTLKRSDSDLLKEDEGEDGVGTQPEVVRCEAFPQGEETFVFNHLEWEIVTFSRAFCLKYEYENRPTFGLDQKTHKLPLPGHLLLPYIQVPRPRISLTAGASS